MKKNELTLNQEKVTWSLELLETWTCWKKDESQWSNNSVKNNHRQLNQGFDNNFHWYSWCLLIRSTTMDPNWIVEFLNSLSNESLWIHWPWDQRYVSLEHISFGYKRLDRFRIRFEIVQVVAMVLWEEQTFHHDRLYECIHRLNFQLIQLAIDPNESKLFPICTWFFHQEPRRTGNRQESN